MAHLRTGGGDLVKWTGQTEQGRGVRRGRSNGWAKRQMERWSNGSVVKWIGGQMDGGQMDRWSNVSGAGV